MPNRRSFLHNVGGVATGALLLTGTANAQEINHGETNRFIMRTGQRVSRRDQHRAQDSGLDIVGRIDSAGIMIVRGLRKNVKKLTSDFAPDVLYQRSPPEPQVKKDVDADLRRRSVTDLQSVDTIDEPEFQFQWGKLAQGIPTAHERTRGEGTRVAVIDSGIVEGHPELTGALNIPASERFTDPAENPQDAGTTHEPKDDQHGTEVAGVIAADDTNDTGIVGSAPGTELVDCRVFPHDDPETDGNESEGASFAAILLAEAYSGGIPVTLPGVEGPRGTFEIDAVDVANMSLGAFYPNGLDYQTRRFLYTVHDDIVGRGTRNGTLYVAAAGNDFADLTQRPTTLPSGSQYVMSVSATGPIGFGWEFTENAFSDGVLTDDELEKVTPLGESDTILEPFTAPAYYTNFGTEIDIAAPGGQLFVWPDTPAEETFVIAEPQLRDGIRTTGFSRNGSVNYNTNTYVQGTSFASPNVAGAAALLASEVPAYYSPTFIKTALASTARNTQQLTRRDHGGGFVNPVGALRRYAP